MLSIGCSDSNEALQPHFFSYIDYVLVWFGDVCLDRLVCLMNVGNGYGDITSYFGFLKA